MDKRLEKVRIYNPDTEDYSECKDSDNVELMDPEIMIEKKIISSLDEYDEMLRTLGLEDQDFPAMIYEIKVVAGITMLSLSNDIRGLIDDVPAEICAVNAIF